MLFGIQVQILLFYSVNGRARMQLKNSSAGANHHTQPRALSSPAIANHGTVVKWSTANTLLSAA